MALLAVTLLAAGVLASSTPAFADSPASSVVVTPYFIPEGTLFYDPSSKLTILVNAPAEHLCDPNGVGDVPVNVHEVDDSNGDIMSVVMHGTNVPIYLYRTNSPIVDLADLDAACASGAFVSPALGSGTAAVEFTMQAAPGTSGNSGMWQQTASGTYVNAAGQTCRVTASGAGPWSLDPYHFDTAANIDTHGC